MKKKSGFSLIEVLVVIAIIAILASLFILSQNKARERGKIAEAKTEVASLSAALQEMYSDTKMFPLFYSQIQLAQDYEIPLAGSVGLGTKPAAGQPDLRHYNDLGGLVVECITHDYLDHDKPGTSDPLIPPYCFQYWQGPYIQGQGFDTDPWGNPYIWDYDYYGPPYEETQTVIKSKGPDGKDYSCDDIYKSFYSREPKNCILGTQGCSPWTRNNAGGIAGCELVSGTTYRCNEYGNLNYFKHIYANDGSCPTLYKLE